MTKRFTYGFVKSVCLENNIELLSENFEGVHEKLNVRCLICEFFDINRWTPTFNSIKRGHGCPKCAGNLQFTIDEVREEFFDRNIKLISTKYLGNKQKLEVACLVCGLCDFCRWAPTVSNIINHDKGCPRCSSCLKLTIDEVKRNLYVKNIKLLSNVYKSNIQKLEVECMICGLNNPKIWSPTYANISTGKGCPHCGILKSAENSNQIVSFKHWKCSKDIKCRGTYEVAVIEHLNKNQIDYNFQPQTFLMPIGYTYTPDLYLPDQDLWVEIKGYFWGDAEEKWNWFHREYSNSELWNKQKLKDLGLWKRILQLQGQKNKQKQEISNNAVSA